jgi:hypothetical protein
MEAVSRFRKSTVAAAAMAALAALAHAADGFEVREKRPLE